METPGGSRPALSDITNLQTPDMCERNIFHQIYFARPYNKLEKIYISTAPSEEERRRLERNRKQHEYRVRIRAQETIEKRDERNKRLRESRARRRSVTSGLTIALDQHNVQPSKNFGGI